MAETPDETLTPKEVKFEDDLLKKMFLEHLNGIYFGKQHLFDFFNEIELIAALNPLKLAIDELRSDTKNQILAMDEIYQTIKKAPTKTTVLGMKGLTLEAYLSVIRSGKSPLERDVFILFYLQIIEGIEITYYKVLKNLAKAIGYSDKFLDQPFDTAVENKLLFEAIYKEYIS
jgi:ferritin-like metal-binding protein YciE